MTGEAKCVHCGQRIVKDRTMFGGWVHQPAGAAFQDGQHRYCETTKAEPAEDPQR